MMEPIPGRMPKTISETPEAAALRRKAEQMAQAYIGGGKSDAEILELVERYGVTPLRLQELRG